MAGRADVRRGGQRVGGDPQLDLRKRRRRRRARADHRLRADPGVAHRHRHRRVLGQLTLVPVATDTIRLERPDQTAIHYRWDASLPPRIAVDPGTEVIVEARPGDDGQTLANSTADEPEPFDYRRLHALSGPIAVRGAEPGDTLVVRI